MTRSLTARAILASLVWVALALGVGGWIILDVFRGSAERQFDQRLISQITLLNAAIAKSSEDPTNQMINPDYSRVYSGAYWQAEDTTGLSYRSRSLWDVGLDVMVEGDSAVDADGPDEQRIRVLKQTTISPDGRNWTLYVAADKSALTEETAVFQQALWVSAGILGTILMVAAVLLLQSALSPIRQLQKAVAVRHEKQNGAISGEFPSELAPLVDDLNLMLERNERLREKGRLQAANLAHALKTPSAILRNELLKLRRGEELNIKLADQAVENVSAAADRHLSLAVAAPEDVAVPMRTKIVEVAQEVVQAIGRVFPDISFQIDGDAALVAQMGRPEAMELLGNLIENAAKFGDSRVHINIQIKGGVCQFQVDDDGPGIPEDRYDYVLAQGARLDEKRSGSGLGLTIVNDIVERHKGEIRFDRSPLGGLQVQVTLQHQN
ncbi:MAG: HAMP domain-containing sensor histidine kinase [Pseudomonadota bacterium]